MIQYENNVTLIGSIYKLPIPELTMIGKNIYKFIIKINRESDDFDLIPAIISRSTIDLKILEIDTKVKITGSIISFENYNLDKCCILSPFVFTNRIEILENNIIDDLNYVSIKGKLIKLSYGKSVSGTKCTKLIVEIKRNNDESDYVISIVHDEYAQIVSSLYHKEIGHNIYIKGKLEYQKKKSNQVINNKIIKYNNIVRISDIEELVNKE